MGLFLYDGLTRAVGELPTCCVKTLNAALDVVNPEARKPLSVQAEKGGLLLILSCPVCKQTRRIHVADDSTRLEAG